AAAVDEAQLRPGRLHPLPGPPEVFGLPSLPARVDRRVLQQDERVGDLTGQPPLRQVVHPVVRLSVRHQPLGPDEPGIAHQAEPRAGRPTSGPKSHVSRFCLRRPRNFAAVAPSMIRWSHDIDRYTMCRMAMASSITTGRFSTASNARMAQFGWLMIGTLMIEPNGPGFVMVNVEPCTSSGFNLLFLA